MPKALHKFIFIKYSVTNPFIWKFHFIVLEDSLYHFIDMHYANPEVLTSVLQEKTEVYFICWYAKLLFFPCLFTESNTAILYML